MKSHRIPAIAAVCGLVLGLGGGALNGELNDDDRTPAQVTSDQFEDSFDAAKAVAVMPDTDPCTLLFGEEIAKDLGIKDPGNGKSTKDATFKSRTCAFGNGMRVILWQESQYTRAVYRNERDFGRAFISDRPANTADFPIANEGTLYYDGKDLIEGLFRTEYGTTVSIVHCSGSFSQEQLQKIAARVLGRLTGI